MSDNPYEIPDSLKVLSITLKAISIVCALVLVILITLAKYYQPIFANRVSIRFTFAVALTEAIKSLVMLGYISMAWKFQGQACVVVSFIIQWVSLLYLSLNVAIAFNLHMVYLCERSFNPVWERFYWILAFVFPTSLTCLALGRLGFDEVTQACEYQDLQSRETLYWIWSTLLLWFVLASVYCGAVAMSSLVKLALSDCELKRAKRLGHNYIQNFELYLNSIERKNSRNFIIRVIVLISIPALTQIWFPILSSYEYIMGAPSYPIIWITVIASDLPAMMNWAIFVTDPALKEFITRTQLYQLVIQRRNKISSNLTANVDSSEEPYELANEISSEHYNSSLCTETNFNPINCREDGFFSQPADKTYSYNTSTTFSKTSLIMVNSKLTSDTKPNFNYIIDNPYCTNRSSAFIAGTNIPFEKFINTI